MSAVQVVSALAAGRKASQLYPPQHPAFIEAMGTLVSAIADSCTGESGAFTLNLHMGRLYHESVVLPDEIPGVGAMTEAFEARKIESMTLQAGLSTGDVISLMEVLSLRPSPTLDVQAELDTRGVSGVLFSVIVEEGDAEWEERDRVREQDRALYHRLVSTLKTMSTQVVAGDFHQIAATDTMVGGIVARLMEDQAAVLGLATLRNSSEVEAYHAVNVMIYTLTLGTELGLPAEGLSSLGTAALTHDIGKAAFEHDDPAQAEPMRVMHSQVGADILSGLSPEDPTPMLVAYEHHMHVDGTGYPERAEDYVGHPFSRMVAIADRYANLTAGAGDAEPLTPDRAVIQVLREAGTVLDPLFSRLFAKALGVFPVGCLVRLTDNAVGVVSGSGTDPLQPRVRITWDAHGLAIEKPIDVDLAQDERTIVEVVDPEKLNTAVADHL